MRLEWAITQHDKCPYKKRKFGHRDMQAYREDNVKTQRENVTWTWTWTWDWSGVTTSQGGWLLDYQNPQERHRALVSPEGPRAASHWFDFWSLELETMHIVYGFKHMHRLWF